MTEWKLFEGDVPHVSTFDFHEHRERAPHLEQWVHQDRLAHARRLAHVAENAYTFVDLGCGDGGLVSQLLADGLDVRGYDFQPTNAAGWIERGVAHVCVALNFVEHWAEIPFADAYIMTECLEHLADPHGMLRRISARGAQLIASSPYVETNVSHDECHAWAWDGDGYRKLIEDAGFVVRDQVFTGIFQVVLAHS